MASELRRPRAGFERRALVLASTAVLPWIALAGSTIGLSSMPVDVSYIGVAVCVLISVISLVALRGAVVYPLRTLSNVLASIREEDYSFRIRGAGAPDAFGEVMVEINALTATLREQRLGSLEATAMVRTVVGELDAAIFTFDDVQRLRLVNRAGETLLARSREEMLGLTAEELDLDGLLCEPEDRRTVDAEFPGSSGRWSIRTSTFRERGRPHRLLVITDLSKPLRDEERQAWQRLLRVIGHELNNSLAPVQSIASSLATISEREPLRPEFRDDVRKGLEIIESRTRSLGRFMEAYGRLARLPEPRAGIVNLRPLLERVVGLERSDRVRLVPADDVEVPGDGDQLEQALINLLRNAIDASSETGGGITVTWQKNVGSVDIRILDEGAGIGGRTSLFTPFFTTKPGGTGIGLVLSRQIAEAHRGSLSLADREDASGCEARLTLPLSTRRGAPGSSASRSQLTTRPTDGRLRSRDGGASDD